MTRPVDMAIAAFAVQACARDEAPPTEAAKTATSGANSRSSLIRQPPRVEILVPSESGRLGTGVRNANEAARPQRIVESARIAIHITTERITPRNLEALREVVLARLSLLGPGYRSGAPIGTGANALQFASTAWFTLATYRYPANLFMETHTHATPTVSLVLRGGFGATFVMSRRHVWRTGSLTIMPAGEIHSNTFSSEGVTEVLNVTVQRPVLEAYESVPRLLRRFALLQSPDFLRIGAGIARELRAPSDDGLQRLALDGLTLELLASAGGKQTRSRARPVPGWLLRARDALHDCPADGHILGALAREVGVSPSHLSAAFRQHFGCSPAHYLRRARVERATRAIESGASNLAEIAVEAGFGDQSGLGKAFRREIGMTPGEFREGIRRNGAKRSL